MRPRRLRHALEHGAFRSARWAWTRLPERMAVRAADLAGLLAGSVLRVRRRDVDAHLLQAFPDRPRAWRARVARASYAHLAREGAMIFRSAAWPAERLLERVELHGLDDLRRAADGGTGAIVLTGHIGNWEIAGAALAASGIPLDVVGKGMANRAFEADLMEARARLGMRVIDIADAPRGVLRALRDGRVVAMLADQNAHRSDLFLPFFGREAATARGPALFAIRTGAPVFVGSAIREPGRAQRYRIEMRPMAFRRTGNDEADTRALLSEYARVLEEAIRSAPGQYFWHHRRWRTRPPEEPPTAPPVMTPDTRDERREP